MKRKLCILSLCTAMLFTAACSPRQNEYQNKKNYNQQQNQGQTTAKKDQLIGGVESSVYKMGDIQRVKVTSNSCPVKSGLSGNAATLQTALKDSHLEVVSQVANWYAVKLPNNQIGFVPKTQAKPVVAENKLPQVPTPDTASAAPQPTQGNATTSPAPKTPTAQTNTGSLTAQEQEMLKLINEARAQNNAPPLQADMQATNVARIKAQDMIDNNYFSHNSPKYGSPFDMLKTFGISYVTAGENIAGNQTVHAAHNALMNSPGHRKNILNPEFTHIGLGIKSGGTYGNMFSQMFLGKPK